MKLKVQRFGAYEDTQKPGLYHVWDHQTNGIIGGSETASLNDAKAFAYDQNKIATAAGWNGVYEVDDHPVYHPTVKESYDPFSEEIDKGHESPEDYEERMEEERAETASNCTCGAWSFTKSGSAVHIADCICGA